MSAEEQVNKPTEIAQLTARFIRRIRNCVVKARNRDLLSIPHPEPFETSAQCTHSNILYC